MRWTLEAMILGHGLQRSQPGRGCGPQGPGAGTVCGGARVAQEGYGGQEPLDTSRLQPLLPVLRVGFPVGLPGHPEHPDMRQPRWALGREPDAPLGLLGLVSGHHGILTVLSLQAKQSLLQTRTVLVLWLALPGDPRDALA